MFINLGKIDKFYPNELINLLNDNTNRRIELGRIDPMQNYSFFEVEEDATNTVLKALNRAKWEGRKVVVEVASEEPATKTGKTREPKPAAGGKKRKAAPKRKEHEIETKKSSKKDDWKQFFQQDGFSFDNDDSPWGKKKKKK